MKFIISLFLIALLSFAVCLYFPWWTIAITSFVVAVLIPLRAGKAFLCGFLALFLLWFALTFWISNKNDHILAHKMSALMLSTDNPVLLMVVASLIGGLIGGLGSLSGALLRSLFVKKP